MFRVGVWALGIILVPLLALYLTLLFTPIPLPFVRNEARAAVLASLPSSARLQLGDMALAMERGFWPVLQFRPVTYTDTGTGAKIAMQALEVGFSPLRALIGQPGIVITVVGPHIQVNQDLLGPRLTSLKLIPNPGGGPLTVRVQEGDDSFPSVGISSSGVDVHGHMPDGKMPALRSDNAWLVKNMESTEQELAGIVTQARAGRFSRLIIRDGTMDMNDAVYGIFHRFTNVNLNVGPTGDGKVTKGRFSADFGGRVMHGTLERKVDADGTAHLSANVTNVDFAALLPFINDPDAIMAIVGGGALSIDVNFNAQTGKVANGIFHVDLTGTQLRVKTQYFPIVTTPFAIAWQPGKAKFTVTDAAVRVGKSTATLSGVFVMGLDKTYGPTVGISMTARNVALRPNDLGMPKSPFSEISFSGWSTPLYGAVGIDRLVLTKPGTRIEAHGRIDMLRKGIGVNLAIAGEGASADDLKRLWPYFLASNSRDWFVKNVSAGKVVNARMTFSFPVGTLAKKNEDLPLPKDAVKIDLVGSGITVRPLPSMSTISITGETRVKVRDDKLTVSAGATTLATGAGPITVSDAALVMAPTADGGRSLDLSGQIGGEIPALVALTKQEEPQLLANSTLAVDPTSLAGKVDLGVVSTLTLDKAGTLKNFDYALNGTVRNFASTTPIQGHMLTDGQISFTASQQGYQGIGKAEIDGMAADLKVDGSPGGPPNVYLSSTLDTKDLKAMGFDVSPFLTGKVRFVARPVGDGTTQMAVDIKNAALTIKDLGISKAVGVPGTLQAAVKQTGSVIHLSHIDLAFGAVHLVGALDYDSKKGLQSADFSTFALSPGDHAEVSLSPIHGGFAIHLAGDQLDLKPMLKHFFGLGEGSTGGPEVTQFDQALTLDLNLKRAVGFYKTTAYNVDLKMTIKGTDLQNVNLQAQLGGNKSVSVTTNPAPNGQVLSVAYNDLGTLLRLLGVYPRVEGGEGSLVISTNGAAKIDTGDLEVHHFSLIDEDKVGQILGTHAGGQDAISRLSKITFNSAKVKFIRRPDRIRVTQGVLTGDTVGGTIHGFIYTDKHRYDLAGTYVPLFGLNSVFQKLPLFGPILGGRNGEGLIGVTFAVRGPLDKPDFEVNPASLLVPGAFRALFEFRPKAAPLPKADDPSPARSP